MKQLKGYLAEDKARTVEDALIALSPPPMVVWRIEGRARSGSSDGLMLIYAVTYWVDARPEDCTAGAPWASMTNRLAVSPNGS